MPILFPTVGHSLLAGSDLHVNQGWGDGVTETPMELTENTASAWVVKDADNNDVERFSTVTGAHKISLGNAAKSTKLEWLGGSWRLGGADGAAGEVPMATGSGMVWGSPSGEIVGTAESSGAVLATILTMAGFTAPASGRKTWYFTGKMIGIKADATRKSYVADVYAHVKMDPLDLVPVVIDGDRKFDSISDAAWTPDFEVDESGGFIRFRACGDAEEDVTHTIRIVSMTLEVSE